MPDDGWRKVMDETLGQRADAVTRPVAPRQRVGGSHDTVDQRSRKRTALYRELQSTYERLCVLAGDKQYDRVAQEVGTSKALLDELQLIESAAEREWSTGQRGSELEPRSRELEYDSRRLLTEILRTRERVLQMLGAAVGETQASLVAVGKGREALARYRTPHVRPRRLQRCRV